MQYEHVSKYANSYISMPEDLIDMFKSHYYVEINLDFYILVLFLYVSYQ